MSNRAKINHQIATQKEGHRPHPEKSGWWFTENGATNIPFDFLASSELWIYRLEGELMKRGWVFGTRDGEWRARRQSDGKILTGGQRDEVIGLAYLYENGFHYPLL